MTELLKSERLLKDLSTKSENYWILRGEKHALSLFHAMAKRVPAYKDFLEKRHINAERIKTIEDFRSLPPIDKDSYLRRYPLESLCWDGKLKEKHWVISSTSGSTGEPFYFPRQEAQDLQYSLLADLYLRTNFEVHKRSTLYIVAFPMGVWIGGVFTYQILQYLARQKNYPLSIITPGINKQEILKAVKNLGAKFDQIIIGSYGPFLKDILDDGERERIQWNKYNIGFVFSAEGFTETFRDYVLKRTRFENPYKATLNHYGTVDLGTMSYETPLAILVRRLSLSNKQLYGSLFGNTIKLPTLTQYLPEMFYFEDTAGNLFCSAKGGIPLVRYDLKDHGGVKTFREIEGLCKSSGIDIKQETAKVHIGDTVWKLPFVYVYERSDLSVSFYAANMYPETIRRALQHKSLEKKVTGKFTMLVKYDRGQNQYIEINVELAGEMKKSKKLREEVTDLAFKQLFKESSEYRKIYEEIGKRSTPRIVFWPYEHPIYFKAGTKQKWVKK